MLRNVINVLLSEQYVLGIVKLKVKIDKFLVLRLDGLSCEWSAPELYDLDVEVEDDHAILPPLKSNRFRRDGL